jgi:8-oxo-dGTP diphosphatase
MSRERPKVGVGIAVLQDDHVLLGKRRGAHGEGTWAFPGGHLEFGETVEECMRRELLEEVNLEPVSFRLGPWTNDRIDQDKHYVTLFVFVDQFKGDLKLMEPHKCEGWEWFKWNHLPTPLFVPILSLMKQLH